jgi:hypothetical protein
MTSLLYAKDPEWGVQLAHVPLGINNQDGEWIDVLNLCGFIVHNFKR